jgi:hypothetical protein
MPVSVPVGIKLPKATAHGVCLLLWLIPISGVDPLSRSGAQFVAAETSHRSVFKASERAIDGGPRSNEKEVTMKRSRVSAVCVAAALGLCIWAGATAQEFSRNRGVITNGYVVQPAVPAAARSMTQPNSAADFNGKLVALSVRGGNQPRLLEKARFEEIHGRRFLVGQEAKATFSFPLGRPAHIAWDAVEAFYVFDNAAQYEEAMRQALEQAQGTVSEVLGNFFPGAKCTVNGGPGFTMPITTDGSFTIPAQHPILYSGAGGEPIEATSSNEARDIRNLVEEPGPKTIYSRPETRPR